MKGRDDAFSFLPSFSLVLLSSFFSLAVERAETKLEQKACRFESEKKKKKQERKQQANCSHAKNSFSSMRSARDRDTLVCSSFLLRSKAAAPL